MLHNFTDGEDVVDLSSQYPGITSFDQLDISATEDGNGVVIDLSEHGGGLLTINGITVDQLDAEDFVFYGQPLKIEGTSGDDIIYGGEGDDTIVGGRDDDTLTGGERVRTPSSIRCRVQRARGRRAGGR